MTTLKERLAEIGGCGDGSCIIHVRPGMHTNGGCRCSSDKYKMQRVVAALKAEVTRLQKMVAL